jgi:hemolysin activation/secretion protein
MFDFLDAQLLFRVDGQVTDDSLLPMEQISIGGRYSVRGYRENFLVRDEGIIASLEARIPVIQNKLLADYIQVCPFYDYGRGDNKRMPTPDPQEISSVGVGLRWAASLTKSFFNLKTESEIYWGYPFTDVRWSHQNLQDNGIHFQIAITGSF